MPPTTQPPVVNEFHDRLGRLMLVHERSHRIVWELLVDGGSVVASGSESWADLWLRYVYGHCVPDPDGARWEHLDAHFGEVARARFQDYQRTARQPLTPGQPLPDPSTFRTRPRPPDVSPAGGDLATRDAPRWGHCYKLPTRRGDWWQVGWDSRLGTYYAQRWHQVAGVENVTEWHGTDVREITTVHALARRMGRSLSPAAIRELEADAAAHPFTKPPTNHMTAAELARAHASSASPPSVDDGLGL